MQAVIADYQAGLQQIHLDIAHARAAQSLSLAVLVRRSPCSSCF
jgi:hypothetical protein